MSVSIIAIKKSNYQCRSGWVSANYNVMFDFSPLLCVFKCLTATMHRHTRALDRVLPTNTGPPHPPQITDPLPAILSLFFWNKSFPSQTIQTYAKCCIFCINVEQRAQIGLSLLWLCNHLHLCQPSHCKARTERVLERQRSKTRPFQPNFFRTEIALWHIWLTYLTSTNFARQILDESETPLSRLICS